MIIRKILKNFILLSLGQIFSNGIMFFAMIYLAHVIGPESLGKLGFAQVFTTYFLFSTDIGLVFLGIREIARDKTKVPIFVDTIISIKITLAIILFIVLLLVTHAINKTSDIKVLILIYGMVIFSFASALDWFYLAVERVELTGIVNSLRALVYFVLLFCFVKSSRDILKVALFFLASYLISTIFYFAFAKRLLNYAFKFRFHFEKWKKTIFAAFPLGILVIFSIFLQQQSILLLSFLRGLKELGIYYGIYKIIYIALFAMGLYGDSIYPILAYTQGKKPLFFSLQLISLVSLPAIIISSIFGADIIKLILGKEFIDGVSSFKILVWSIPLTGLTAVFSKALIAKKHEKKCIVATFGGLIINTVAGYYLIHRYGLNGAALSYVFSLVFLCLYMGYYAIKISDNVLPAKEIVEPQLNI